MISAGLISASSNITNLRKDIYEYAMKNSHLFLGKEKNGRDSVFIRSNGYYGYPTAGRKGSDPIVVRAKIYNDDVTSGIYSQSTQCSHKAPFAYWMKVNYVLPIFMHLYKVESIVVYSSRRSNSNSTFTFFTDIYLYNPESTIVTFTSCPTLKKDVPPGSFYFIYLEKKKHFKRFRHGV